MNSVLNLEEIPVNDVRLARCQHPRLRQALMFQPTTVARRETLKERKPSRKPATSFQLAERAARRGTFQNLKGAAAVAFVRLMSSLFDGQIVTA
jgi:hypothetical protein